ncbi:serine-rich single-pass membrane protein 1 [Mesoplodon densirostris]|uniref:serine-rich single-pass membrane protein 1 n=1 Tax=Mesoplodon densirostris TaxID=48708 RepID=UPI0028DC237E|nr:serine-rich single-pass membrane protein 1 [Mesoplodon densirostris]
MGDLFSLFWEVGPPPIPVNFTIPNQDYECQKDDSCGTIGNFLLWYFVITFVLMLFSRASVWMSEKKKNEDNGTSSSLSKASKDTSYKRQNKDGAWDSLQMMTKPKQNQLTLVTGTSEDSEVSLVNAYLKQRRARHHSEFSRVNQTQPDSGTTECEVSNSGASSWKESENEHHQSPASIKKRKIAQRRRNMGGCQIRERPSLHCKAMRTNEWVTRHFLQNTSLTTPMKGDIQEGNSGPGINIKFSKF